jgi:hypothetical protein
VSADETRTLTPREVEHQRRGGRRLGPGFWVDRDGAMHMSVPELLAYFALDDTPANRAEVARMFSDQLRALCPNVTIVEQDEES